MGQLSITLQFTMLRPCRESVTYPDLRNRTYFYPTHLGCLPDLQPRYLLHSPNMLSPIAYALLRNGFADWEAASALAELQRTFGYSVRVIGLTSDTVVSMGGLRVATDLTLFEFVPDSASILILPGGDAWTKRELPEVSHAVRAVVTLGRPVAAICAATLALAHAGLLDDRLHTSNGAGFIETHVREYRGQSMYRPLKSVRDRGVITANGLAPFAFAAEIFRALVPGREGDIETYERFYSRGLLDS
jgi:putative intracellular protease/amidase